MEKSTNKFRTSFILFFSTTFISILSLLIIQMFKILKLKIRSKLKNNKPTKILSLERISNPITLEESVKTEKVKYFTNAGYSSNHSNERNFIIEYEAPFGGSGCEKKFIFQNDRLKTCNYILQDFNEISNIQKIYEKIAEMNGVPDEIKFDKEIFLLQYVWYGKNGTIVYNQFYQCLIVIILELNS